MRQHREAWQRVNIGEVIWEQVNYRASDAAVNVPILWRLHNSEEWVRVARLEKCFAKAQRCLMVENENCLHLLPPMPETVAVFGAGMNLAWTDAAWLRALRVGYWGDMDSWGLAMLAQVRRHVPEVTPLLMRREVFDAHADKAVKEPASAGDKIPPGLNRRGRSVLPLVAQSRKRTAGARIFG